MGKDLAVLRIRDDDTLGSYIAVCFARLSVSISLTLSLYLFGSVVGP